MPCVKQGQNTLQIINGKSLKIILIAIIILSLAGLADSSYALYQHYAPPLESACDVSATVSCTAVNQSDQSVLLGVPVAAMGMGGYLVLAALGAGALAITVRRALLMRILFVGSLAGLVFSGRLTYIELFNLNAVCPLCVTSQTLILLLTLLALWGVIRTRSDAGTGSKRLNQTG